MARIILVRHGETAWNKEARYQGHANVGLSDAGRAQAAKAAERLREEAVAAVYSSDLDRAYETAERIASEHGLTVEKVPGLREIHFGEWEGLSVAEIKAKQGELYGKWREDPLATRVPGGETAAEVQKRAIRALEAIAGSHPAETVVVVAHGGTICSILCHFLGCGFWECLSGNTGISILEYDAGGVKVAAVNDTAHLAE